MLSVCGGASRPSNTHTIIMGVSEEVWRAGLRKEETRNACAPRVGGRPHCVSLPSFFPPSLLLFLALNAYLTWLDFPGWGRGFFFFLFFVKFCPTCQGTSGHMRFHPSLFRCLSLFFLSAIKPFEVFV